MPELTENQRTLMRHALGLHGNATLDTSYRNYFYTGPDCTNFSEWESLVANGFATRRRDMLDEMDENFVFAVTEKGKDVLADA